MPHLVATGGRRCHQQLFILLFYRCSYSAVLICCLAFCLKHRLQRSRFPKHSGGSSPVWSRWLASWSPWSVIVCCLCAAEHNSPCSRLAVTASWFAFCTDFVVAILLSSWMHLSLSSLFAFCCASTSVAVLCHIATDHQGFLGLGFLGPSDFLGFGGFQLSGGFLRLDGIWVGGFRLSGFLGLGGFGLSGGFLGLSDGFGLIGFPIYSFFFLSLFYCFSFFLCFHIHFVPSAFHASRCSLSFLPLVFSICIHVCMYIYI